MALFRMRRWVLQYKVEENPGYIHRMQNSSETQKIDERFDVLNSLGEGGMGLVLKCKDTVLNRIVAVKLLNKRSSVDAAQRFQHEAKAAARLNQENILKVLDFGETSDGRLFLVMDFADGITLAQLIEKGPLAVNVAIPIILQLCRGISHAHAQGVLHRDIKPSNIMLTSSGSDEWLVRIVDFGIARLTTTDQKLTATGVIIGSPPYVSPEAILNQPIDARSDIYSIGCLIFEMLTGSTPFRGETAVATLMMHADAPVPTMADRAGAEFDPRIEKIVGTCLEKQPEDRYRSVDELSQAIEQLHTPLRTASDAPIEEPKKGKRTIVLLIGVTVCLVFILALSVVLCGNSSQTKTKRAVIAKPVPLSLVDSPPVADVPASTLKLVPDHLGGKSVKNHVEADRAVDNAGLARQVAQFKNEESWILAQTKVKGEGLKLLVGLPIVKLDMTSSELDDEGMKYIGQMKNLTRLELTDCKHVTSSGFKYLQSLNNLKVLHFSLAEDNAESLKMVESVSGIKSLNLLKITGELDGRMIEPLRRLKNLSTLKVDTVTEDSHQKLKELERLNHVKVSIKSETSNRNVDVIDLLSGPLLQK